MDRIDLLRIFARVVECANFTRAADTLAMPRSSVSAAIQELEGRLGTRLLHRTTRKVSATLDGSALYERCLHLIADMEDTENLFRQTRSTPSGKLRVDMPARIGRLIVAPALPGFLERYPQIDIEIGMTDRVIDLVEERVDCVLRVGTPPNSAHNSALSARSVGDLALINVASPAYLRRHGVPERPEDLDDHWMVGYTSRSSAQVASWEWMEGGVRRAMPLRCRVSVNSAEAYIACCLSGVGLIQIPAYDVQAHLRTGELVEILGAYRAAPMPMMLLYPQRQQLSRRLHVFADWLEALLVAACIRSVAS
ncbi:LysR family transcriptional regulator [Paraburkholderia sp. Ac-20336]|uniref:LysR family transcriptional regulator n=1 Tax=Paraburkholderia sp. Ac-20336 TaxID=2703886 RepID=UPI00197D69A2|nr:LysR family transcriptional regulator [Paraburkholderia sp. Ac-20336]MBN3806727.1 LysR family transcriptional regulator [Paraburkholderia sp. Ac-20336]